MESCKKRRKFLSNFKVQTSVCCEDCTHSWTLWNMYVLWFCVGCQQMEQTTEKWVRVSEAGLQRPSMGSITLLTHTHTLESATWRLQLGGSDGEEEHSNSSSKALTHPEWAHGLRDCFGKKSQNKMFPNSLENPTSLQDGIFQFSGVSAWLQVCG